MLVTVIVDDAEGSTTGRRKGVILMSTEVVGINMVGALVFIQKDVHAS
jgi:hypothetical protein